MKPAAGRKKKKPKPPSDSPASKGLSAESFALLKRGDAGGSDNESCNSAMKQMKLEDLYLRTTAPTTAGTTIDPKI